MISFFNINTPDDLEKANRMIDKKWISNTYCNEIKNHPDYEKVGMILCHNGIVRSTSRDGRPVTGLTVQVDHTRLHDIIEEHKQDPGIIEILVEIKENRKLSVGEDVMYLIVAGDIRENVIHTLQAHFGCHQIDGNPKNRIFENPVKLSRVC